MDIYVRQDQSAGGEHLAAAEADLRGRRGARGGPLRRSGGLGSDDARHVRDFRARLRERHRAELHRRSRLALLRVAGAVVLPGLVPRPRPGLAARPAAMRAGRPEPVRRPRHRGVVARYRSTMIVTGPSLTRDTFMSAPKTPVWTRAPRSRRACTTASTRGSATGPGAAADQDGRRPLARSAQSVNWLTTSSGAPLSERAFWPSRP